MRDPGSLDPLQMSWNNVYIQGQWMWRVCGFSGTYRMTLGPQISRDCFHRSPETSIFLSGCVSTDMKRILLTFSSLFCILSSCAMPGDLKTESENGFNPMLSIIEFYRGPLNHLSAVKQSECPMYPSCSAYSVECLQKHGPFTGWMMSCDRLMRCGRDELRVSPKIRYNGELKCYDPVENNDFWWSDRWMGFLQWKNAIFSRSCLFSFWNSIFEFVCAVKPCAFCFTGVSNFEIGDSDITYTGVLVQALIKPSRLIDWYHEFEKCGPIW